MRIATWNINSIRARLPNVLEWLVESKPDVLCLQEIKCETGAFPRLEFESAGYHLHVLGQKSYNGVAMISPMPMTEIVEGLSGDNNDTQARYCEATINGVCVVNLYLPNGNPIDSDKYTYKLDWMRRLKARLTELLAEEKPLVVTGDFNVIPEPQDVYDPKGWENDALYHPRTRAAFREIVQLGFTEAFRALHPTKKHAYTFWDYQAGAWERDNGLRIDHFLLSPEATDRLTLCHIDRTPRGKEKASDHTPVILELNYG